ncbi:F510_1955 family glycosylhydrolase [Pseudonocardia sp. ICBG1034]|uniref:F510_1955 family glycosylhydrolase n=1 Tax=Pseudonocardia sp. ICBG1034 TaxID=2844381 RepID=UPI001CCB4D20|nr:sialidase family protein [Pseudonocardia sp. ICBG1034]
MPEHAPAEERPPPLMIDSPPVDRTNLKLGRPRAPLTYAVLTAGIAVLLMGCGGPAQPAAAPATAGTAGVFEQVGHVHGVGVDPADGSTVIAGHHGLFSLTAEGTVTPRQNPQAGGPDLMGFTVAGPNTYLASGHPAPQDTSTPNPLGLVRSTDRGATWEPISLHGEVDFHALDVDGTVVAGLDATRGLLLTSTDSGQNWQQGASLSALDIALAPGENTRILATTEAGVMASHDGGTTFTSIAGSPLLAYLAWADDGSVYGIAPEGTLYASTDRGVTWQRRGATAAPPQAISAEHGGRLTVVTEVGVERSTDGGVTLQQLA